MLELTNELTELDSTLFDAKTQLTALTGDAAQDHLSAVSAIVAAMEQARLSADSRQQALSASDVAATAAADAYFEAIATVREVVITGGDLVSEQDAVSDLLISDLALNDDSELGPLLDEVQTYDDVGVAAVEAAGTALSSAEDALASAERDLEHEQAALDAAGHAVKTLAAQAIAASTLGYQQLAAVESARAAGRPYEAVVHLQDLTKTLESLTEVIALDPAQFDADVEDATILTNSLMAVWTAARDSYEDALAAWVDAQETVFEGQLALAAAEADAQDRAARRLIDAAAMVETAHNSS